MSPLTHSREELWEMREKKMVDNITITTFLSRTLYTVLTYKKAQGNGLGRKEIELLEPQDSEKNISEA